MNRKKREEKDDSIKTYFEDISRYKLLTAAEEADLSARIERGEEEAKKILINSNLRLVVKIAKEFVINNMPLADLIQEGNIGLIRAASRFDYRKEVRFSTYASWWIKQSVIRALNNKRRTIRLPYRKEDSLRLLQKTIAELSQKYMRQPSISELSEALHMQREDIVAILEFSNEIVSLDNTVGDDLTTFLDVIEDRSYTPEKEMIQQNIKEGTRRFINNLLEKEKQVLLYRFSFYNGKKYTLKKISDAMGISPETVRQIELRALKKLRTQIDDQRQFLFD